MSVQFHVSPWVPDPFSAAWADRVRQRMEIAFLQHLGQVTTSPSPIPDSDLVCPWRPPNPTIRVSTEDGAELWSEAGP
jgi:hypothetical protein